MHHRVIVPVNSFAEPQSQPLLGQETHPSQLRRCCIRPVYKDGSQIHLSPLCQGECGVVKRLCPLSSTLPDPVPVQIIHPERLVGIFSQIGELHPPGCIRRSHVVGALCQIERVSVEKDPVTGVG